MNNLLADIQLGPLRGFGSLGLEKDTTGEGAAGVLNKFLSGTIGILTIIAIIWFVFTLISGAIGIMTAGDDKQGIENAKKRITTGLVGLVIVIIAIFLISLFGWLFGIENILNPAAALETMLNNLGL